MKLRDLLKIMGIKTQEENFDAEIIEDVQDDKKEETKTQALEKKEISINVVTDKQDKKEETVEKVDNKQEGHKMDLSKIKFENGKFTGIKTLTEEDSELKTLLESVNAYTDSKNAEAAIDKTIKSELSKYSITDGISESVVLSALNRSDIKYLDNKVLGVEEAFASLAKDNAGMLKIKDSNNTDKSKTQKQETLSEGPALEGFSKDINSANPLSDTDLINFAFGSN